ncbi:pwwp domain containing protein [Stylonychia lemnae]|uniref:Pwwp domain containing protein n=1 Tax=Stylonychia lemnae TaxID=5949 RepID=A0A078BA57_STYLE|nr:pwwp domain containing protein [Stylonychia lemnae]|eukprot:CDW91131.1 pwwp domain containing protein [Stylonychia lemnae]
MSTVGSGPAFKCKAEREPTMFKRNDIVWAKVRGYSWWPAKIGEVIKLNDKERKYRVDFIGDNTHQILPQDKIEDFINKFTEHSKIKKKDLLDAIEQARKKLSKDDQLLLEKQIQQEEQMKKQIEKGGINLNDDQDRSEKAKEKCAKPNSNSKNQLGQAQESSKQENAKGTAVSHSSNDQTATPTKASIMDMPFQNGKLASKKNIDQEKSNIKDKTLILNKRTLKSIEKDFIKQKKLQRSQSVDGASKENNDEEESQIICTKSRGIKGLKRQRRTLEKRVLSEVSKEDKEEIQSVKQNDKEDIEQQPLIDLRVQQELEESVKESLSIRRQKSERDQSQEKSNFEERKSDLDQDREEPMVINETVKVRRESAQRARGVIQKITNKPHKQHAQKETKSLKLEKREKNANQDETESQQNKLIYLRYFETQSPASIEIARGLVDEKAYALNLEKIKNIIKYQQQEEEQMRRKHDLNEVQLDLLKNNKESLIIIQQQIPKLNQYLMQLQKAEISIEILSETGIGKTLKYLSDYCETYREDLPQLQSTQSNSKLILQKWRNHVNKCLFEEKTSHVEEFSKEKYKLKVQKNQKKNTKHKSSCQLDASVNANDDKNDRTFEQLVRQNSTKFMQSLLKLTTLEEPSRSRQDSEISMRLQKDPSMDDRHFSNPERVDSSIDSADHANPIQRLNHNWPKVGSPYRQSAFSRPQPHQQIQTLSPV